MDIQLSLSITLNVPSCVRRGNREDWDESNTSSYAHIIAHRTLSPRSASFYSTVLKGDTSNGSETEIGGLQTPNYLGP